MSKPDSVMQVGDSFARTPEGGGWGVAAGERPGVGRCDRRGTVGVAGRSEGVAGGSREVAVIRGW
jgi:hypothetical protein